MDELKPCPFCGGIPDIGTFDDEGNSHIELEYEKEPWSGLTYGIIHDYMWLGYGCPSYWFDQNKYVRVDERRW